MVDINVKKFESGYLGCERVNDYSWEKGREVAEGVNRLKRYIEYVRGTVVSAAADSDIRVKSFAVGLVNSLRIDCGKFSEYYEREFGDFNSKVWIGINGLDIMALGLCQDLEKLR